MAPGARVADSCEPPDLGQGSSDLEIALGSSAKTVHAFNFWTFFLQG